LLLRAQRTAERRARDEQRNKTGEVSEPNAHTLFSVTLNSLTD
jgi:hypothetical protein